MTTTNTNKKTAAYVTLAHDLIQACTELGLPEPQLDASEPSMLPGNKGWVYITFGDARLYIQRTEDRAPQVHSHVDLSDLPGYLPLPKPNGKVICHFTPDKALLRAALPRFVGAAKRATIKPASKATPVAAAVTPVETLPDYSEQDFEEEALMYQTVSRG